MISMIMAASVSVPGTAKNWEDVGLYNWPLLTGIPWLIGNRGHLPWRIPRDLAHFKAVTSRDEVSCLIMGRKTAESVNYRLPGRKLMVLSRSDVESVEGVTFVNSMVHAQLAVKDLYEEPEAIVAGGGEIYSLFEPLASIIYLTLIRGSFEGDTYLDHPPEPTQWFTHSIMIPKRHPKQRHPFAFLELHRRPDWMSTTKENENIGHKDRNGKKRIG